MEKSILNDIKNSLDLAPEYMPFDKDLVMHINSVLSDLHQLGVGPTDGFEINDEKETWTHFLNADPRLNSVKSYVFLRVKMIFDPPDTGYVITAYEKLIEKAEWRITVAKDEIDYPPGEIVVEPPEFDVPFGDVNIQPV